jgi:hypothetical protein
MGMGTRNGAVTHTLNHDSTDCIHPSPFARAEVLAEAKRYLTKLFQLRWSIFNQLHLKQ